MRISSTSLRGVLPFFHQTLNDARQIGHVSKRALIPVIPALAAAVLAATPALADAPTAISSNWAGYEAMPVSYSSNGFSDVSGSWIQPTANCTAPGQTYSAFWVGLGGSMQQSGALEQVGTQADCTSSGQANYFAWYELVPSAPVQLSLQINPGDQIDAAVHVSGTSVTVSLADEATGGSVQRTLQMSNPDTSTAEWIAEAPSTCDGGANGSCTPLPLTDFGTVDFGNAAATANAHTGTVNDPNWSAQPLALDSSQNGSAGGYGYGYGASGSVTASGSAAGAQASALSSDGSSFSVSYSANGISPGNTASSGTAGGYGYGGSGYGYGYGYGGGDPYGGGGYGLPGIGLPGF
jgi:hypothetical protein